MKEIYRINILLAALLAGCTTLCFGQTFSFTHDNISRSYIVHLPTNYNPANQYPLVINMHGLSSDAPQQEFYTGMNAVADTGNFIVIYPNGISNSWNSGFNVPYNSGIDDVGFLSALLDTAIADYTIDTLRMYACGMSNGGFMSYRLACELEHRIAAIASVTGSMSDSMEYYCPYNRAVPVMQVHGTTDPTVNYNGAPGIVAIETTVDYWVQRNNCPATAVTTAIPDTSVTDLSTAEKFYYGFCDDSTEVVLFKITNGGHTWPGAFAILALGNTNQDFNASGEIWKFFQRHSLGAADTVGNPPPNPVSVSQIAGIEEIKIWPNPSSEMITISGIDLRDSYISILNMLGQVVSEQRIIQSENGPVSVNVSNLGQGVYLVKIPQSDRTYTRILVVK